MNTKHPRAPRCMACGSRLSLLNGIGGELRKFRLTFPMSQDAMAKLLGVCRMTINNVETGSTRASFRLRQRFNALKEHHERNRDGFSE